MTIASIRFEADGSLDIRTEYDLAHEEFLALDEMHQIMPDPEWLCWLKRKLGRDDLFVYRHRGSGRFVLCHWLYPPGETVKPVAQELEGWTDESGLGHWPSDLMGPQVLLARLKPIKEVAALKLQEKREQEEAARCEKTERTDFTRDYARMLDRKGMRAEAHNVRKGAIPVAPVSDAKRQQYINALT